MYVRLEVPAVRVDAGLWVVRPPARGVTLKGMLLTFMGWGRRAVREQLDYALGPRGIKWIQEGTGGCLI